MNLLEHLVELGEEDLPDALMGSELKVKDKKFDIP